MTASGFSLEPPPVLAYDGRDEELFAPPARLLDVTNEGLQVFSRADPEKSISERLIRIWQERGDFSQLTAAGIRAGKDDKEEDDEEDARPTPQDMRELQGHMMEQLALARQELATALDLLSVIAPLTDPPTVDLAALPLPPQTLTIVPSVPPPAPSADSAINPLAHLPLATSLASVKSSAAAFFAASEKHLPPEPSPPLDVTGEPTKRGPSKPPSPWPTLLHLRSATSYTLLPIGALPGASINGKGETRAAREVGVFYGCVEAKEAFRRGSVARISDLLKEDGEPALKGRVLVVGLKMDDDEERLAWSDLDGGLQGAEAVLAARSRAAFSEELFAVLSQEARADASVKAKLMLGKRSEGDSVELEGHGWTLTLTMVSAPSDKLRPIRASTSSTTAVLLPLLRLLFLQDYAQRHRPASAQPYVRPILQTVTVFLSHAYRLRSIITIIDAQIDVLKVEGIESEASFYGDGASRRRVVEEDAGEAVLRILRGDKELGGRALLRIGRSSAFHITFSLLLPQLATPATVAATAGHQSLLLQAPCSAPVAVSSLQHLQLFLAEQVGSIVRRHKALRATQGAGKSVK